MSSSPKSSWTAAHLRWLATLKMLHPVQQIGFQEYLNGITESTQRIERLEQAMRDALQDWRLKPVVQALQALRGVQLIAAMTLVACVNFLTIVAFWQLKKRIDLIGVGRPSA